MEQPIISQNPQDLLLTDEQYRETAFAKNEQRSYVFELENGEKKIVYFGSSHTNDPEDPLFQQIQEKFQESAPEMVYIEGWRSANERKEQIRETLKKENIEDVKKEGESHFALKLAVDAGADFESPEPDFSDEINYLLEKGFSKKDIFYFYMYRDIDQYLRQNKNRSMDECAKYLRPYFARFKKDSDWEENELNLWQEEILSELNVEDDEKYNSAVDPIPWEGKPQIVLNEISRNSSNFRDRYILQRIIEGLKKYNKIFVVYGSAHAVKQEDALRAAIVH